MAHIHRTFTVGEAAARLQERFTEDIGPELHRIADFRLETDKPGRLCYSDGLREPGTFGNKYAELRVITAHRLHVTFEAVLTGTEVTLRGSVPRELEHVLALLGDQGQWPHRQ